MTRAATCIAALAVAVIAQAAQVNLGAEDDWDDYPSGLLPLAVQREVCYVGGCYHLQGDGVTVAYSWIWMPAARPRPTWRG